MTSSPKPSAPPVRLSHMLRQTPTLLLACSVLFMGLGWSLALPFLPLFVVNKLHLTPFHLGVFLTANALSTVFISAWLGRRTDRTRRRRPAVLLTLLAAALGFVWLAVVRSFPPLLLGGALLFGLGGAAFPQLMAFARASFAHAAGDLPERTVTLVRSAFSLAWVIGPPLGSWVLGHLDFSGLFLVAAGCTLAALLPVLGVSESGSQVSAAPIPEPASPPTTNTRPMHWVILAFVLYGMSLSMSSSMYPLLVTKTIGGSSDQVGLLISFTALMEIPFMFALVTLRRLPNVEKLVIGALALYAVYFAVVVLATALPTLYGAQLIRAVVIAILAGLGLTYFQGLMPGQYGVSTTLFMNTTNIGGVLSGVVAGAWAQAFGYRAVFTLCGALTFVAFGVMLWMTTRSPRTVTSRPPGAP